MAEYHNSDGNHERSTSVQGMSRRQLMRHAGWFGGAVVLTVASGEVISHVAGPKGATAGTATGAAPASGTLRFVQISDSHIGFQGPANTDVTGSFAEAINQVNSLGFRPDFVMHSGDLTHLSTAGQFDQVRQMMTSLRTDRVFTVPGEHDSIGDAGRAYRQMFAGGTLGDGWYSFDTHGVHFIALVNTLSLEKLGHLGNDQIEFVRRDLSGLSSDTPVVIFSHIPLFAMYPRWGWSTDDALKVIALLRRFASVTCLNGHVHQLFTKTEGNITFHSATTTAYPLPKPGRAPAPTPQVVPARQLKDALGIRTVGYHQGDRELAVIDRRLA
ncbi:metallophosphoesterase [Streptomyces sp. MI02-2A]|uniref:metallophosphoesterase family protein n=1 Tax=unclassified Streptomyces TaxID=2593676 RepID=UPI000E25CD9F|nr:MULTISPECIES: metallophosphoesterase [unclassified Streptomyces]MDX3262155.1 metallophosphoesterase [Streptomyces sp. MI02-2A]REE65798.1 calcineurin-like phosphoesterase family protein [Streptomyces sp. 3212.3]